MMEIRIGRQRVPLWFLALAIVPFVVLFFGDRLFGLGFWGATGLFFLLLLALLWLGQRWEGRELARKIAKKQD